MAGTILLVIIAGAAVAVSVARFVSAARKLATGEPDTHAVKADLECESVLADPAKAHHRLPTRVTGSGRRQDKPPLVIWMIASSLLAAAGVVVVILAVI